MSSSPPVSIASPAPRADRIVSIDALRGLVMATMIYVNDIAGAGDVVPGWMVHYSERHASGSGMTFVDLVFPAFLFIVGLSLPVALESALARSGSLVRTVQHILIRAASLLLIGVLMVNEPPDAHLMGWSPALWSTLLYVGAIAAFCDFATPRLQRFGPAVRTIGFGLLAFLAVSFVGADGHRIVSLHPLELHHEWWGILGLIGWAYLVGAAVFLVFRRNPLALLGSMALLFCLYPAERAGLFEGLWLARHVGFGATLGSQAAITVGGVLFAVVITSAGATLRSRVRFALLFAAGTAAAAILVHGLYGIWKNSATPSWCLWACAITAAAWLPLHFLTDVHPVAWIARPLSLAGRNVLLAYLLSDLLPSVLVLARLDGAYAALASTLPGAIVRSIVLAVALLAATVTLNRSGFRLKL